MIFEGENPNNLYGHCASGLLKTLSNVGTGDNIQMKDRYASSSKIEGCSLFQKPGPNQMLPPEASNLTGMTQRLRVDLKPREP